LMGGFVILFLYSVILFRVGVIARRIMKAGQVNPRGGPEIFPALMVFGLGFSIVLQALFHMGVNVGALPVTGQTLPLVSMGGTSLWFVCASLGIILNTAYSFSSEGLEEEVKREKRNFFIRKVEVKREGVEEGDFEMERERSEHKRRVKKKVSEEDVFDVWTENDSQDVESGIEDEGREVLKELQRRRRRQYKDNEDFD